MFVSRCSKLIVGVALWLCLDPQMSISLAQWHVSYRIGLEAMRQGEWSRAVEHFQRALQVKTQDTRKIRSAGAMFIEYFPHRELGICYFNLGDLARAKQELETSLAQTFSERAKNYLDRINRGDRRTDSAPSPPPVTPTPIKTTPPPSAPTAAVGDRFTIAVLPFEGKGIGGQLGQIDLLDKLITGFVSVNRFKIIERAQLEKVLEEQKLGLSGVIDASTAAEIGKGIGADGVICGSVISGGSTVSIDARLIDTETAAIITARDAYSSSHSLQNLSQMITEVANKIKADLPLVNGYVISVQGETVTIDLGLRHGIKKGMKCHVFREGAPIVHPVTNEVIGKSIDQLCEVQVTDVFDAYAVAMITKLKNGMPAVRDKVVTK
jgi:TolB-like protein